MAYQQTYLIVGMGVFGQRLAMALSRSESDVIVVDENDERLNKIRDLPVFSFQLDSTVEEAWKEMDVSKVDSAIVAIGKDMMASILTVLLLKKFNIPRIVARANTDSHAQILELLNVSEIIRPEIESAEKLAGSLLGGMGFVLSYERIWKDHAMIEVRVNKHLEGQTLINLDLRQLYKVNVIAIKHPVSQVNDELQNADDYVVDEVPNPRNPLREGDILIILGKLADIARLEESPIAQMR
ncbi:MAG: potassium channel family protein [Brevinema sp.]